LSHANRKVVR